jgi:LuxR family maltose regulon positive regulatory protein
VQHAIDGGDFETAIQLIEVHALDMLMQWHARTVRGWLKAIPPKLGLQTPRANFAFAWMHLLSGDFPNAMRYIEALQRIFSQDEPDDPALQAEWMAMQALMLNAQGQAQDSLTLAEQALQLVPPGRDHIHSLIYMAMVEAYQQIDDHPAAMRAYEGIIQHGRAAGNPVTTALGVSGLGLLTLHHGNLNHAYEITTREIESIERSGVIHPIDAAIYGELAVVYYHRFQLDAALSHFLRSMQVSKLSGYPDAELFHGVILSRLYEMKGDLPAATAQFDQVLKLMKADAPAAIREEIVAQQVRLCLAQDDRTGAEEALRGQGFSFEGRSPVPEFPVDARLAYPAGQLYNSALRIMLHRARRGADDSLLADSIRLADQLMDWAAQNDFPPIAIETVLLRAQLHAEAGARKHSAADYRLALETGQVEAFITDFVEAGPQVGEAIAALSRTGHLEGINTGYLHKLLGAFEQVYQHREGGAASNRREPQSDDDGFILVEPLTDREIDVLRQMSEGLKYQEIADRLYISLNTVRFYVKSIYGKLGVNNRVKAISRATMQGML